MQSWAARPVIAFTKTPGRFCRYSCCASEKKGIFVLNGERGLVAGSGESFCNPVRDDEIQPALLRMIKDKQHPPMRLPRKHAILHTRPLVCSDATQHDRQYAWRPSFPS
jgi:hypothetical protein